ADLQCHRETVEDRHEELFEEVQRKDHDHGGEIEPHRQRGQAVTDGTEHRLGGAIQEAHDRVVGVRVDPRQQRPGDDEPDEHDDDEVHQIGDRAQEVRPDEHRRILTQPAVPRPSSFERCVARSTALMNVVRMPPSSSAATPAIDVPPGLDTMSLRAPGCRRVSSSSLAAPSTVWVASVIAVMRSSPIFTPPSARDSITRATYAGPEPERPVTASMRDSSRTTTRPTALKISPATSRSPGSRPSALAIAVTPSRTSAGVLGMTRMSRASLPSPARSLGVETPAAIEMRSFRRVTAGAISLRTSSMIWGLTARITTSARRTSSPLPAATWMPYWRSRSLRRSCRTSVAKIASAGTRFAASRP